MELSSGDDIHSNECVKWKQEQLYSLMIGIEECHSQEECSQISGLLAQYHDIFSLDDNDRGETDFVEFKIDTGDSCPRKLPARRIPFAACEEVAAQLKKMQDNSVIRPSESPWPSPVVW